MRVSAQTHKSAEKIVQLTSLARKVGRYPNAYRLSPLVMPFYRQGNLTLNSLLQQAESGLLDIVDQLLALAFDELRGVVAEGDRLGKVLDPFLFKLFPSSRIYLVLLHVLLFVEISDLIISWR